MRLPPRDHGEVDETIWQGLGTGHRGVGNVERYLHRAEKLRTIGNGKKNELKIIIFISGSLYVALEVL